MDKRIEKTIKNLEKNNMKCFFLEKKEEVIPLLENFIKEHDVVSVGGSVTLSQLGVIDYLRSLNITFLDRYAEGLTSDDLKEIFRKTFFADVFITSTNAICEDGTLYNVDGRGNRVAAMIYGPDKVIVIAGVNKIVKDLDEAIERVKNHAAPSNAKRLELNTPCTLTNKCSDCESKERICRNYVLIKKPQPNRIYVILVNETLGY
ncbi:MAG: lactate utilization protein [Bacilli bacterium]|nr:lactate utilization protein [Bacilli bacterium]